jgi:hypothetical protein
LQSCQKEITGNFPLSGSDSTLQGLDTTFLPLSVTSLDPNNPDDNITVSFQYLPQEHKIKVYVDDTATTNPYDKLALTYFYNPEGYFMKREGYDETGRVMERFSVERGGNNLPGRVLYEEESPVQTLKDTFNISFADSAANPSYKNMTVNFVSRTSNEEIKVTNKLTYLNNQLRKISGGTFFGQTSSVVIPGEEWLYDASGKLTSRISDSYYGTSYAYETSGRNLDSFFHVLGGRDAYYLDVDGLWSFNSNSDFTFFPLYLILGHNSVELYTEMHRYGVLKEVRSIPNGSNFPEVESFSFQNTFDSNQRVRETRITNNGLLYAVWKIKY